ncbi:phage portal protein [Rhizorhabdus histidinilytica]|nr:anti-CBASS Acb1 family protein [Rhizorhabdus histidinilytica]
MHRHTREMAWITDSLRTAIGSVAGLNPLNRAATALPNVFTHQLALVAYMSSGMLRKVIAIPADDRVREWRDWQASKDDIALIEAEEARLGLQAKVKQAEVLRGIGGGALILITAGDHAQPLKPEQIAQGGLVAVNVVSRWQISGRNWIRDLASPDYGAPTMWEVSSNGKQTPIHPSRVVCFRGEPIPAGGTVSDEDAFWGDSRLLRVYTEVQRADETQGWFAALVRKAKLLRIGIPDLDSMDEDRIAKRVGLIAEGEGILNATVFRSAGANGDAGETVTDYQVTWTGIPAVMDAFDQRVAAVADIPFTRLMGRSPAGMNSTGQHDTDNWNRAVASGQNLETKPCLNQIDPILLRSAGVAQPDEVTWKFAPLWTPTEKEEADTFKTTMDAVTALMNTGAIPEEAFNKGVQNLLTEREYIPGLDQALEEVPEAERYGGMAEPTAADLGGDPSAIAGQPRTTVVAGDAAHFFADAKPRPLYVQRKLLNADELIAWAKSVGFTSTLPAEDMHVTVLYSRTAVDPIKMGESWNENEKGEIAVKPGGPRAIERLGENAVVLLFASSELSWRHESMVRAGGSHDYGDYQPHVTLTYEAPAGIDLDAIKPFTGRLLFGPELFEPLDLDWKSKVTEA